MSSSEEDISMLQEAIDPQFATHFKAKVNEIPAEQNAKASSSGVGKFQASVRHNSSNNNMFNNNLGMSPEFKNHIAKKLQKILDSQIELRDDCQTFPVPVGLEEQTNDNGIRLFASSKSILPNCGSERDEMPPRQRQKPDLLKRSRKCKKAEKSSSSSSSSSSDEMDKLASVAVSSEWVLSGRGVHDFPRQDVVADKPGRNGGAVPFNRQAAAESPGGGHHRNVCRKKKHKDSDEKDRPERCSSEDNDGKHFTEDLARKKHKHSKKKKKPA